eukprot:Hpha_TRINITY_DN12098_c0_g1::TRINITY_DN12098_c0_g1_i1::g.140983::m.140983
MVGTVPRGRRDTLPWYRRPFDEVSGDAFSERQSREASPLTAAADEWDEQLSVVPPQRKKLEAARLRRRTLNGPVLAGIASSLGDGATSPARSQMSHPTLRTPRPASHSGTRSSSCRDRQESIQRCALVTQLRSHEDRLRSLDRILAQHDATIEGLSDTVTQRRAEVRSLKSQLGRGQGRADGEGDMAELELARETRREAELRATDMQHHIDRLKARLHGELNALRRQRLGAPQLGGGYEAGLERSRQLMRQKAAVVQGDLEGQFTEERLRMESRVEHLERALQRKKAECEQLSQRHGELRNELDRVKQEQAGAARKSSAMFEDERRRGLERERTAARLERDIRLRKADVEALRTRLRKADAHHGAVSATPGRPDNPKTPRISRAIGGYTSARKTVR